MNHFWSREGVLTKANSHALLLKFSLDEEEKEAIALKEVCYGHPKLSKNLLKDFKIGDKFHFSALLDSKSPQPDKWKVISAWTHRKPLTCFTFKDWDDNVQYLYKMYEQYYLNFWERSDSEHCSFAPGIAGLSKILQLEQQSVLIVLRELENQFVSFNKYFQCDSALRDVLSNVTPPVKNYICRQYNSWINFVEYHSELFVVSVENMICPLYNSSSVELQTYLNEILPSLVETWNAEPKNKSSSLSNTRISPKVDATKKLTLESQNKYKRQYRNLKLEQKSVSFLLRTLKLELSEERVYNIYASNLNNLMSSMPGLVKCYVKQTYGSLGEFFKYHDEAFSISANERLYPKRRTDLYLYEILPQRIKGFNTDQQEPRLVPQARFDKEMHDFNLEQKSILYFANKLVPCKSFIDLFSPNTKRLEALLDEAPKEIKDHIEEYHTTLTSFLDFHESVFHITSGRKIYSRSISRIKKYILSEIFEMFLGPKQLKSGSILTLDFKGNYFLSSSTNASNSECLTNNKTSESLVSSPFVTADGDLVTRIDEPQDAYRPTLVKENCDTYDKNHLNLSQKNLSSLDPISSTMYLYDQSEIDLSEIFFSDNEEGMEETTYRNNDNIYEAYFSDDIYQSDEESQTCTPFCSNNTQNEDCYEKVTSSCSNAKHNQETSNYFRTRDVSCQTFSTGSITSTQYYEDETT